MKEITLGDWLKDINESLQLLCEHANGSYTARWIGGFTIRTRSTPENALQALCECYYHDDDTLLDIGRSRQWEEAHGPDGVAGLCDGEAGVVVCRDGALYLVEKLQFPNLAYMLIGKGVAGYPDTLDEAVERVITEAYAKAHPVNPDTLADAATRPCETSLEEVNPNDE